MRNYSHKEKSRRTDSLPTAFTLLNFEFGGTQGPPNSSSRDSVAQIYEKRTNFATHFRQRTILGLSFITNPFNKFFAPLSSKKVAKNVYNSNYYSSSPSSLADSAAVRGFIVGNRRTSRIDAESVRSITKRSTPKPRPPVGGIPCSRAIT